MFVAVEDVPHEQLVRLPRTAFSDQEWEQLDEEDQDAIFENDQESQGRVDQLAQVFIGDWRWQSDPQNMDESEYVENYFEPWLESRARASELYDILSRRRYQELVRFAEGMGLDDSDVDSVLNDLISLQNYWAFGFGGWQASDFHVETRASLYADKDRWQDEIEGMFVDEVERAIKKIDDETNGDINLDIDDFDLQNRKRYPSIEVEWDPGVYFHATLDEVAVERDASDLLRERAEEMGGTAGKKYEELESAPPEERVVYRWPDGFYVQDLTIDEIKKEGPTQGICVHREDMGYLKAVRKGEIKILSLRRPSGKPLFTIEASLDKQGRIKDINQVKGKANRLPGFDLGKVGDMYPIKRDEVERILEFIAVGAKPLMSEDLELPLENISDVAPAAMQVYELYNQRDPWATKMMKRIGVRELPPAEETTWTPVTRAEDNPGRACGLHGEACTGFCRPYRRRTRRNGLRFR